MKKTIILVLIYIVNFNIIYALTVDKETAKTIAINFMNDKLTGIIKVKNVVKEKLNGETAIYVVNFQSGGWAMVSSYKTAVPVLSFNLHGEYNKEDERPEAFIALIASYKEQIISSKDIKLMDSRINSKWKKLLEQNGPKTSQKYTPDDYLLNVPGRGHVQWGQTTNYWGNCDNHYNYFFPKDDRCRCEKESAGCGAVAMGQIMWYWQWPKSPPEGQRAYYNWDWMPPEMFCSASTEEQEAHEIAYLLKDCALASDMKYGVFGIGCFSWTTTGKIEDAFKDDFKYESAKKILRWEDSDAWNDLMRSEIDNGRPVLYRGDKRVVFTTSRYFFVLDGYDADDPDYFSFNFGWGSNIFDNTSYHYLNDITPSDKEYNKNQRAIVGISPTYSENIYKVPYLNVYGVKKAKAMQDIVLPGAGESLIVEDGGDLTLTAGNSITLKPGFHAKAGSKFTAQINPDYKNMNITVENWYNAFVQGQELCYNVENANSWEFTAIDRYDNVIFESAGSISGNEACVWDGSGAYPYSTTYGVMVRFKNNYGRDKKKAYMVYYLTGQKKSESASIDSLMFEIDKTKEQQYNKQSQANEDLFTAYPNPSDGIINLKFSDNSKKNIKIYDPQGVLCYQTSNIKKSNYKINMNDHNNGLYIILVEMEDQILFEKILLKK